MLALHRLAAFEEVAHKGPNRTRIGSRSEGQEKEGMVKGWMSRLVSCQASHMFQVKSAGNLPGQGAVRLN